MPCHVPRPRPQRRWRRLATVVALASIALAATLLLAERTLRLRLGDWAKQHGYHVYDRTARMRDSLLAIPGRWLGQVAVPHLRLDVKFRHMQRIWQKREEALRKGLLETEAGDLVPGTLTVDGSSMKVKLRLKGDWTDHLQGDKWSFRIEVGGDHHVFGMRRFSLQAPETRGFQGEPVFFRALEQLGVVTPRYRFVTLTLNGTDMGLMALEEHFARELLEHRERRESAIVHFDETLVFHGVDDYRVAPIVAFQEGRLAKSPTLTQSRATAVGLLHAFVRGTLAPSEVFRVDELAAYLAAAELFGSHHCLRWHNLRFYHDPVRGRLGPIGFDANLHERQPPTSSVTADEPIVQRMLADPVVQAAFTAARTELCRAVLDGSFVAPLRELDRRLVDELRAEYLLLDPIRFEELVERARTKLDGPAPTTHHVPPVVDAAQRPLHARAWLAPATDGPRLELANALLRPMAVTALWWTPRVGTERQPARLRDGTLPWRLPGQRRDGAPDVRLLRLLPPADGPIDAFELAIETSYYQGPTRTTLAVPAIAPLRSPPVPNAAVAEQLRQHPFLTLDADGPVLRVTPGEWLVSGVLVVPPKHTLAVSAGTRLRFPPDGALVAHGPVQCVGEADRPIELLPADPRGWRGVAVLDPGAPVRWQHTIVRDTTGVEFPGWQLTGGVAFVGCDVRLTAVRFDGTRAEDALNIVDGAFELIDLLVTRTRSDAFDADFADGAVHGGSFTAIGGDAIDISGSTVVVEGTRLDDVRDKALSVGEGSTMRAFGVHIGRTGTGAACKDASRLDLRDARIDAAEHFALAAYVKKQEFGAAAITATRIHTAGAAPRAVVQRGSSIVLDGVAVPPQDLDVDALYASIMQKDPGR